MGNRAKLPLVVLYCLVACAVGSTQMAAAKTDKIERKQNCVPGNLQLQGGLAHQAVSVSESIPFWVTIKNNSACSASDLRLLAIYPGGLRLEELCSSSVSGLRCSRPNPETGGRITETLSPGQTVTTTGTISVTGPTRTLISLIIAWRSGDGWASQSSLAVGEVEAQSALAKFASSAYQLLEKFALPLVVVAVTWAFGVISQRRDQRRQEQERVRAMREETLKQMLPESHRLATKFYMPLAGAIRGALEEIERYLGEEDQGRKDQRGHSAFWYALLVGRRMKQLAADVGGFYLKDRVGEVLVWACWGKWRKSYPGDTENVQRRYSEVLDQLSVHESFAVFLTKLDDKEKTGELFRQGYSDFLAWLKSQRGEGTALRFLRALDAVLEFEMNRPYEYWYDHEEKIQIDSRDRQFLLDLAKEIAKNPGMTGFEGKAASYLDTTAS